MTPLEAENRRLRDRVATLEEALRQARDAVRPPLCLPASWRMTPTQEAFLLALYAARGRVVTREAMRIATRGPMGSEDMDRSLQNQHLCHIRSKVREMGLPLRVHVVRGLGWCLDEKGVRIIGEAVTERPADGWGQHRCA